MTEIPVYNTHLELGTVATELETVFGRYEIEFARQRDQNSSHMNRFAGWVRTNPILIKTTPGSGKTTKAIEFVNRLADKGVHAAYLSLSHSIVNDMFAKNASMSDWGHWRGHGVTCEAAAANSRLQSLGYTVEIQCACDWSEQFRTDRPTIMPVDYSLATDIDSVIYGNPENIKPRQPNINKFDIRIFDEIDVNKFVGAMDVNFQDLAVTAASHPDKHVRTLSKSLIAIWNVASDGDHFSDESLIFELRERNLDELVVPLQAVKSSLQRTPWLETDHPANFAPLLVPILLDELVSVDAKRSFNPRIHLIKDGQKSKLALRWRRQVPVNIPVIFMDASADEVLLSRVFGGFTEPNVQNFDIEIPDAASIKQYPFGRVGMQTLNIRPFDRGKESRRTQHDWLEHDLQGLDKSLSVGIVTFKELEAEFSDVVGSLGFNDVKTAHYGNLRSINDLEDSDVLVLMGCPTPSGDEVALNAQAFFFDEAPVETSWNSVPVTWELLGRNNYIVRMGGFIDDRVNAFQVQSVEWELYQALHRSRPIRLKTGQAQQIFVYTNVPIPFTKISGAVGRWGHAVDGIHIALSDKDRCSAMAVAKANPWPGVKLNSQEKWVRQHAPELASLAGVSWSEKRFRT